MIGMIQNILESQIDKKLLEVKGEIKTQGTSKLNEYKKEIPSKEEIISLMKPYIENPRGSCSIKGQAQVEKLYKKLKRVLEKTQTITLKIQTKTDNTHNKLTNIKDKIIPKIKKILATLSVIITILNLIVKTLPMAMGTMIGITANGAVIKKFGDMIDIAKAKIGQFKNAIKSFTSLLDKNIQKVLKIIAIMVPIVIAIKGLLVLITSLIAILELLYLKFLQICNVSDQEPIDIDGNINVELLDMNSIIEVGMNIMDSLDVFGGKEVIEKMYNANFQVIGYKRYKI